MKFTFLLIVLAAFLFGSKASAQIFFRYGEVADTIPIRLIYTYTNPLDLMFERDEITGILRLPDRTFDSEAMRGQTFRDTLFFNPLFLPMIFRGDILPRNLSFYPTQNEQNRGILIPQHLTFAPLLARADFAQDVRRQFYIENPDRIRFTVQDFPNMPSANEEGEHLRVFDPLRELIRAESSVTLAPPSSVMGAIIGRRYWTRSGEHSLQFSQNFFSENWHGRGTSHTNINNAHIIRANFRRERVQFNNTLEWELSLNNAPGDTLRNFSIGTDFFRYTGNFGIDAFGRGWSYTTSLRARTPLFNTYPPNSEAIRSALLSPLEANMGIGLKYTLDRRSESIRHRRVRWDLTLAPISIDLIYVNHPDVNVRGVAEGENHNLDLGSTVTSLLIFDITRFITWRSRFEYFTSFSRVRTDFENTLSMALTNAFSTRIQINLRYDDGVTADDRFGLLQVNQMLSFGLNYRW